MCKINFDSGQPMYKKLPILSKVPRMEENGKMKLFSLRRDTLMRVHYIAHYST